MSYVEDNLISNEVVVGSGKIHWIVYFPGAALMLPGFYTINERSMAPFASMMILLGAFLLVWAFITIKTTELAVTNKRIIAKSGFIRRDTIELNHSKVESLGVEQSILGRILGYGTITINGTGGVTTPILRISKPLQFRKMATQATDDVQQQGE